MAKNSGSAFYCTQCGNESRKWMGRCPACGEWNTLVEEPVRVTAGGNASAARPVTVPVRLADILREDDPRVLTGIGELDRVLGGGVVPGSLTLIGGDPGIGKSTLLLQCADNLASAGHRVLYLTGEESHRQVAMRAARLGARSDNLFILSETDMTRILPMIDSLDPAFVVVDSIQTVFDPKAESAAGSVTQVRECAASFMNVAKVGGRSVFLVGHVTKAGALAGPRILEHMVDTVLYFEGDAGLVYRVLRAVKNRFGSTNEIGLFEMRDRGMEGVANPSEMLLSHRSMDAPGSVVVATVEGTRPMLVEVQSLVSPTVFGNPRRQSAGVDYNRMVLLLAVLEKRAGMPFYNQDAYLNVVGGLRLTEPAVDLGIALAAASALTGRVLSRDTAVFGEVGLTGEVRPVSHVDQRLGEAARAGFSRVILPRRSSRGAAIPPGMTVAAVGTLVEALNELHTREEDL